MARHQPTSGMQNGGDTNRKWKYLLNGKRWRRDFNGYPHIFDHARLKYATADMARRRPTSATYIGTQDDGDANRKLKSFLKVKNGEAISTSAVPYLSRAWSKM